MGLELGSSVGLLEQELLTSRARQDCHEEAEGHQDSNVAGPAHFSAFLLDESHILTLVGPAAATLLILASGFVMVLVHIPHPWIVLVLG